MSLAKKDSAKIQTRTEKLTYDDGSVVFVKRVPRAQLAELQELQESLWRVYVDSGLSFAALITDDEAYCTMETILSMLPTVSGEPVDFSRLCDDYEQLARFFCSRSLRDDGSYEKLEPSVLASLHHLNYGDKLGELFAEHTKRKIAEQEESDLQAEIQKVTS
jgi:hypothetical protein